MRTKNSFFNIVSNILILLFRTIMLFIVRTFFIKILGEECLGINGLFTNILSMLSLAELGIGTAISFSLYKPLADNNIKEISAIISFYKRIYKIIGIVVLILGLILLPFIPSIVGKTNVNNVIFIYLLYLFNTVNTYFISYKDTLITADQKKYKLTIINFLTFMLMYVLQIVILLIYKSFVLYILVEIVITVIQRIFINRYITKEYKNINFNSKDKIQSDNFNLIKQNIKSMVYHKIGNQLVNSTDNIIISKFVNVVAVGVYTNYLSLVIMVNTILCSIFNSITASFGNLVVLENKDTQENVFNLLNFLGFIVFGYATICFAVLLNPFIELWIGKKYLLSIPTVLIICINFYLKGMCYPIDTVKEASGLYKQDKYVPILQAIINLIISILLAIYFGVIGVVIGTLISSIVLPCWIKPFIIHKHAFKSSPRKYYLNYILNFVVLCFIYLLIHLVINIIHFSISIFSIIAMFLIVTIIYILVITLLYRNNKCFKFYYNFITEKIVKLKKI